MRNFCMVQRLLITFLDKCHLSLQKLLFKFDGVPKQTKNSCFVLWYCFVNCARIPSSSGGLLCCMWSVVFSELGILFYLKHTVIIFCALGLANRPFSLVNFVFPMQIMWQFPGDCFLSKLDIFHVHTVFWMNTTKVKSS